MDADAIGLFRELWLSICENVWSNQRDLGHFYHQDEEVLWRLQPAKLEEVESSLPGEEKPLQGELPSCVFLEPLKGENAIPIVRCQWDFEKPGLNLRVILLKKIWGGRKTWESMGFRIDSPEEPSAKHPYWHLQWIKELDETADSIRKITKQDYWVPGGKPAIPIPAKDPTDAWILALVSLYGVSYLQKLYRSRGPEQKLLGSKLRGMGVLPG